MLLSLWVVQNPRRPKKMPVSKSRVLPSAEPIVPYVYCRSRVWMAKTPTFIHAYAVTSCSQISTSHPPPPQPTAHEPRTHWERTICSRRNCYIYFGCKHVDLG